MDTQEQVNDIEIGTVEPVGETDTFGFIEGAIVKYRANPNYHRSLSKYIINQLNQREKANPFDLLVKP